VIGLEDTEHFPARPTFGRDLGQPLAFRRPR
jgi:hypothetical protein